LEESYCRNLTFIGVIVLIGIVVQNYWPGFSPSEHPIERLFILFVSGVIALTVYNLIKGEEPEVEVKEKQGITSKEISEKLAEMRNKGN
jgi:FtsH-binding integral membrane protein